MKAIFITYSQAYNEEIAETLYHFGQLGYTRWTDIGGQGTNADSTPHLGSHAWPEMNHAILTIVEDDKAEKIMQALHKKDEKNPSLGLRAFLWNVESSI